MHDFNYDVNMQMDDDAGSLVPGYGYREPNNEGLKETARKHYMGSYYKYYPQLTNFLLNIVDNYRINDIYDIYKKTPHESKFFSLVLLEMEDVIVNESADLLVQLYDVFSKCFFSPSTIGFQQFSSQTKAYIYRIVENEINCIIEKCYDYIETCYEDTVNDLYTPYQD